MVGAGFSRGARATVVGAPKPPLWGGIARVLRTRLYPDNPGAAPPDPLRLAQEFEDTLSREVLHALLAREVGDRRHRPGPNHHALLRLPWTDVLTTNYDTLIERAIPSSGRRYTTVYSPADLPSARAPRIVKLHGSLPDHPPLIITEEDYRTYDDRFAPFVTLARARLVEDALVLVGFSGDDPNFLRWTGWVRDHLAEGAPPLYFVTLDLPDPKRTLLVQRNVAPIDLGSFFPTKTYPDPDERHELALRWFLAELKRGEPMPPADWPELPPHRSDEDTVVERLKDEGTYARLPDLLTTTPSRLPQTPPRFETGQPVTATKQAQGRKDGRSLADLIDPWRTQRERYPGWLIAPKPQRDRLFDTAYDWLLQITRDAPDLDAPDDLRLVRELVWRMDRALFPLFRDGHVTLLERVLRRYNPYPARLSLPDPPPDDSDASQAEEGSDGGVPPSESPHTPSTDPEWDWARLGPAWMSVAVGLLQTLRERGDETRFRHWAGALQPLASGRDEWAARLGYETALLHLDRLDDDAVRDALRAWPETLDAYAFGEVHRASVLLELGDRKAAADAAGAALDRVLADQAALTEPSVALQSQEAWARNLLDLIGRTGHYDRNATSARPLPPEVEGLPPDVVPTPVTLLSAVGVHVEKPYPTLASGQTQPGFDVGQETRSYSGLSEREFRPAAAYLRMRKEGGYPLRAGRTSLDTNQTPRAAGWIRPLLPATSYAILLRFAGDGTAEPFNRTRVAALSQQAADGLYDTARTGVLSAFSALPPTLQQSEIGSYTRFQKLVEVLSRLAVRLRGDRASQALDDGIRLASAPRVQSDPATYKLVGSLVQRAAEATDDGDLAERMQALMDLPLEGRDLATGGMVERYFEPARFLRTLDLEPGVVSTSTISSLTEALAGGGKVPDVEDPEKERGVAQAYAAMRLVYLYQAGALTAQDAERFGSAYWSLTRGEDVVPTLFPLNAAFALGVPASPEDPDASERVRSTLLATLRESQDDISSDVIGSPGPPVYFSPLRAATQSPDAESASRGVRWSPSEAAEILSSIASWWDVKGPKYAQEQEREREHGVAFMSAADMLRGQLKTIPLLLADVVLPFLGDDQSDEATEALRILDELNQAGFATSIAAPFLLRFGLTEGDAADKVRADLYSDDVFAVDVGVQAVYLWARRFKADEIVAPPETLVRDVLGVLAVRRGPGLARLASATARILSLAPDLFGEDDLNRLAANLAVLQEATAYPAPDEALVAPSIDEKAYSASAAVRAAVVRLARATYDQFSAHNLPIPEEVERWREVASEAPLPETRRAWIDPVPTSE